MSEENRQALDVDVLFIGAGSASLAGALYLKELTVNAGLDISIAIIEKAREIGAHSLSGAIIDPRSLNELIPNHLEKTWADFPGDSRFGEDESSDFFFFFHFMFFVSHCTSIIAGLTLSKRYMKMIYITLKLYV